MQQPPEITDRAALARNRLRALRQGAEPFLQEEAAVEIKERLGEVNRRFTKPLIIGGFPDPWGNLWPDARRIADTDLLDIAPRAHDLVIHAFGLHWANDPVGQLVQCRQGLAPDGLFLGVMFGGRTLSELRAALAEAESGLTGGLSPRVLPMAEIRDIGGLLQRAGFALPVADSVVKTVTYRTAFHLMADLRAMGEGNALAARNRRWPRRALFPEAARIYAQSFPADEGRIRATFEMLFLTGWSPHETQPKPLRPGSAARRLADALRPGSDRDTSAKPL